MVPLIRAFTTPLILFLIIAVKDKYQLVARSDHPVLNLEAIECLKFLKSVTLLDPYSSAFAFVNK